MPGQVRSNLDMGWQSMPRQPSGAAEDSGSGESTCASSTERRNAATGPVAILYSRISRGCLFPLVEATADEVHGNSAEFVDSVLLGLDDEDKQAGRDVPDKPCRSLSSSGCTVHVLVHEGLWFTALTATSITRQVAFAYLEILVDSFKDRFGGFAELDMIQNAGAFELQEAFEQSMLTLAERVRGSTAGRNLVGKASERVRSMKNNMVDPLETVAKIDRQLTVILKKKTDSMKKAAKQLSLTTLAMKRQHRVQTLLRPSSSSSASSSSETSNFWASLSLNNIIAQMCCARPDLPPVPPPPRPFEARRTDGGSQA